MNKYFICMDSGGTKTYTAAISLDGKILLDYTNGIGSPAVSYDEALQNIEDAIDYIYQNTHGHQLVFIELGISGIGAISNLEELKQKYRAKYQVGVDIISDAEEALHAVLKDKTQGMISIAGTGNATIGTNNQKTLLVGGGGPLLNEQGSCYSSVHQSCLLIKDKYERGLSYSSYDLTLMKEMGVSDYPELKTYFYRHTKKDIAIFSKKIIQLVNENNQDALQIMKQQAFFLADQVNILSTTLNIENGAILGLSGGLFKNNSFLVENIKQYLESFHKSFNIVMLDVNPVWGCYYLALKKWQV